MDFTTTEASDDLGGLVRTITESVCTNEHQRELDSADTRFDRDLWAKLIDADVLSAAAPEALGGGDYGVLEQVAVLEALGRQLAAVPYLESAVLAAGALAKFGSAELQQDWAAPAVAGSKVLTVALAGDMGDGPVQAQASEAGGSGYRLTGTRAQVAYGPVADAFLVPADTGSGTSVFLVSAADAGVTVTPQRSLDMVKLYARVQFDGVEIGSDAVVGNAEDTPAIVERQRQVALILQCAELVGILDTVLGFTTQ